MSNEQLREALIWIGEHCDAEGDPQRTLAEIQRVALLALAAPPPAAQRDARKEGLEVLGRLDAHLSAEPAPKRPLTFEDFTDMNQRRCQSTHGFHESLQPDSKYTLAHWALSIASEVGEVCDDILGYEGLKERRAGKTKLDIATELADVVTYCDLAVYKLGYQLGDVLLLKFNEVNERLGEGRRFHLDATPIAPNTLPPTEPQVTEGAPAAPPTMKPGQRCTKSHVHVVTGIAPHEYNADADREWGVTKMSVGRCAYVEPAPPATSAGPVCASWCGTADGTADWWKAPLGAETWGCRPGAKLCSQLGWQEVRIRACLREAAMVAHLNGVSGLRDAFMLIAGQQFDRVGVELQAMAESRPEWPREDEVAVAEPAAPPHGEPR